MFQDEFCEADPGLSIVHVAEADKIHHALTGLFACVCGCTNTASSVSPLGVNLPHTEGKGKGVCEQEPCEGADVTLHVADAGSHDV